ncbi:MAG: Hpt domain-containing protein [Proteobacteria bacterium]|uniref:hybrid sensor histidine kinase/response regulator n=1 Tax=Aquabacterium sp. TaxID=1872578 RepID=UPI0035C75912|nr:Hpt domain-containing protein [Pseudomonadota bacterium]
MDSLHPDAPESPSSADLHADDLSALAWVQEELRKSLESAHKALHRALKDRQSAQQSDVDALDPAVLRTARQQIHQGVGALELAGLPAGAALLRASEAVVQKFVNRPSALNADAVRDIERASFALLDYMARRVAGKQVSAVALFPQYEALVARVGGALPRPSDLWSQDWPALSLESPLAAPTDVAARRADADTVAAFETGLLSLLRRQQPEDARALAELCSGLARDAEQRRAHRESATWMLASGFLEGLAGRHIEQSVHAKRVLSSLLSQLRVLVKGDGVPSDRLASELLFFCAQAAEAQPSEDSVLARVRRTFGLERHRPVSLVQSALGRHDPAVITQALKRVGGAKEGWSAVAAGEVLRLGGLGEQFSLVGDSLRKLFPDGEVLADALNDAVQRTVARAQAPDAGLAMEVATSLLYVEACLEDAEFDQPEQRERAHRLAERIRQASAGQQAGALEGWMEDLYRRVSDRQTIGSVVQELRATLSECEKHIDQFFRDPQERSPLIDVPQQLQSIRGVLAVLGLDMAAQASVHMRQDVEHLLQPDSDLAAAAQSGVFDRLASNLGALGFLIDMMGVQPGLAKSLFAFDEASGVLSPLMGREKKTPLTPDDPVEAAAHHVHQAEKEAAQAVAEGVAQALEQVRGQDDASLDEVSEQLQKLAETHHVQEQSELADQLAAAQAALASARAAGEGEGDAQALAAAREQAAEQVALVLADLQPAEPVAEEPVAPALPLLAPEPVAEVVATGLEEDDEMRDIFLEEAREVIGEARNALGDLQRRPDDINAATAVRRAFHTLKGSSRMVGLKEFGEAGWACEQLYNTWLASQQPVSEDLRGLSHEVLDHLAAWTEAIAARQDAGWHSAPVVAAADAMRLHGRRQPVQVVAAAPAEAGVEVLEVLEAKDAPMPELVLNEQLPEAPPPAMQLDAVDAAELLALDLPELLDETAVPQHAIAPSHEAGVFTLALDPGSEAPPAAARPQPSDATSASSDAVDAFGGVALDFGQLEVIEPTEVVLLDEPDPTLPGELAEAPLDITLPDEGAGQAEAALAEGADSDEQVKVIGPLRISIPLFNIYLNEADEQSRRLCTALTEWALEGGRPVSDEAVALAHSLAGNSAAVGYSGLSQLARLLEHSLMRAQQLGQADAATAELFNQAADEIRQLLHQFAAGFLREPSEALRQRLIDHDHEASRLIESRGIDTGAGLQDGLREEAAELPPSHLRLVHSLESLPPDQPLDQPRWAEIPHVMPSQHAALAPLHLPWDDEDDIDVVDQIDPDLFAIFEEEALELLPQLSAETRQWLEQPQLSDGAAACMRTLHTFKGGARLAGAMRLGELAHRLESAIERLLSDGEVTREAVAPLEARVDHLVDVFEALRQADADAQAAQPLGLPPLEPAPQLQPALAPAHAAPPAPEDTPHQRQDSPAAEAAPLADAAFAAGFEAAADVGVDAGVDTGRAEPGDALPPIAWSMLPRADGSVLRPAVREAVQGPSQAAVRVRPQLLDRLVNHAGEVAITRSRLQGQVGQIRGSLTDLTDNLDRLRQQLRDIELQAETQLSTRMEAARAASQQFDPLEFDRYTRFQELTRMMAESVNDVATVQRTLQRSLETTEDQLAAQARLTRDLQDDLLRTRMVEFEGLSERLYRVVRQAAKETGKQVRLDIVGGSTEVDRGVLERMTGAFEHLLRNCVSHGIEPPEARVAAGKDATGTITVTLSQEGNEVSLAFSDDGAGLQLDRIRQRAVSQGLISPDAQLSDAELAQLIFTPGFSTAEQVTELAGRGVGMDVVRAEVNAMGGRIETQTQAGQGTRFSLVLPLTTAVTRVVMLRCGQVNVAVPTHLIEMVRRAKPHEVEQAYREGQMAFGDQFLPFFWLGALLDLSPVGLEGGRSLPVVIVRSAQQRIAVHVDEVLGNQEVVVKNLGSQLARLPGLAGMTLLPSGAVSLIYNPVALATVYGTRALDATARALQSGGAGQPLSGWLQADARGHAKPQVSEVAAAEPDVPLVLVVDDSLTVRRVTQRLLVREGYRVLLAKDGLEALESLAQERPAVVLSDIEMPRMDGFDLVRNIRADQKLADLPVIMITSRIAQKHRDYAEELGVNHYLGKPYREEELLALVGRYASAAVAVVPAGVAP